MVQPLPQFNSLVKTKIDKVFFKLLEQNFPKTSKLYKIFNRNTVKLSYSCMPNVASLINGYNMRKTKDKPQTAHPRCNCRNKKTCPLQGMCQQECVIYQVKICKDIVNNNDENSKIYIGSTQNVFKKWYYNHISSFNNEKLSTTLSTYIYKFRRDNNKEPILKWEILKRCPKYRAGNKVCHLCLEEKLAIALYNEPDHLLNSKAEILSKCRHKKRWLLD